MKNTANPERWSVADGYAPMVGDRFHKPARNYTNPLTGEISPMPESNAHIIAMSHDHVVVVIDGAEHTMRRHDFAYLAKKTLAGGSTLSRHNTQAKQRPL